MNQKIQLQLLKIIGFPPKSQKINNCSTYKGTYMGPSVFSRISSIFYITYIKNILFESAIILYLKYYLYNTQHTIDKHEAKIYVFSTAGDNSAFFMLS